ncbi:MAG: hypothetical protein JW822_00200 [Spirochaetales bacterium]|nr:hypothetical protein [Spirochaetales bacterium]
MKYPHPFRWIEKSAQKYVLPVLAVLAVGVMVCLYIIGMPLQTQAAPLGIVSFEFAGSLENAQQMIGSWGKDGPLYAGLNMGLDYLYLVLYSCALGLGCVLVARGFLNRCKFIVILGIILSWAQICAALLDSVENLALIRVLLGSDSELWPPLAFYCAVPKFVFVTMGALYCLIGGIAYGIIKVCKTTEAAS